MIGEAARTLVEHPDRLVLFLGLGGWLAYYNVKTLLFQNAVVLPGAVAIVLVTALLHDELLVEVLVSGAAVFAVLFVLEWVVPGVIGVGTVKASTMLALLIGYMASVALLFAAVIGGVYALRMRGKVRRTAPSGPTMFGAACFAVAVALLA